MNRYGRDLQLLEQVQASDDSEPRRERSSERIPYASRARDKHQQILQNLPGPFSIPEIIQ